MKNSKENQEKQPIYEKACGNKKNEEEEEEEVTEDFEDDDEEDLNQNQWNIEKNHLVHLIKYLWKDFQIKKKKYNQKSSYFRR